MIFTSSIRFIRMMMTIILSFSFQNLHYLNTVSNVTTKVPTYEQRFE